MKILKGVLTVLCLFCLSGITFAGWRSETIVDGKKVVTGDEETMKREAEKDKYAAERMEKLRKSEKRKDNEPITVALYRPTISDNMKQSVKEDIMFDMLVKAFKSDPIIQLVDQGMVDNAQKSSKNSFNKNQAQLPCDIVITPHILAEETAGISKSGKIGKMVAMTIKAEIVSNYLPEDKYEVKESGNIFANAKIINDFAKKATEVMKTKPHIPNAEFKKQSGDAQKAAVMNALQNLFKKK